MNNELQKALAHISEEIESYTKMRQKREEEAARREAAQPALFDF